MYKKEKIIAAYYSDGGYSKLKMNQEDASKLTHLNYAFAVLENGKVTGKHLKHVKYIKKCRELNPDLKLILSIGGWGAGGFSEAVSTEKGRKIFVDTAIELMKKFDFDGIDIDWEYPGIPAGGISASKNDKYNFTLLLEKLRKGLDLLQQKDQKKYLLTIAVGAYEKCVENLEVEKIATKYLDFINLMTYDMGTGSKFTHHHTNLFTSEGFDDLPSVDKTVSMYQEAGVTVEKLVIGGAFYGRAWSGVDSKNNGLYQPAETNGGATHDYSDLIHKYINKNGYQRYWDDIAKAPFLFNGKRFISYDDEKSLIEKAKYIEQKNLAGIMFWEYPLDGTRTLLEAIYNTFK